MRRIWLFFILSCLLASSASAESKLYTFPYDAPPAELSETYLVAEDDVTITLSFAGDCTLGGETSSGARTFAGVVKAQGYAYPFANLLPLFANDDLTVANLEGVLSDDKSDKVKKQYNFIGKPEYVDVLTLGSVECVSLANNHALDYGERGKADTIAALDGASVAYFDDHYVTVLEKDGLRIGLTGSLFSPDRERYLAQVEALHALGCVAIVHVMHNGQEYADTLTPSQKKSASFFADNGASLIVGHHPHVVQGMDFINGVPVVYSLGNCVFGGNSKPRDFDACIAQATLHFQGGTLTAEAVTLYPIRVSGTRGRNDYQPVLLSGDDAARVLQKMQKTSGFELSPYVEGAGAMQPVTTPQQEAN